MNSFFRSLSIAIVTVASLFSSPAHAGYDNVIQNSNGNSAFMSMENLCLNGFITSWRYEVAAPEDAAQVWAKFVLVPAYGNPIPVPASMLGWEVHVWDSLANFLASPFQGTYFYQLVSQPDLGNLVVPVGFGTNGSPVFELGFSLRGLEFQPGHDYRISIRSIGNAGPYSQCGVQTPVAAIQKTGGCPTLTQGGDGVAYSQSVPQASWPNVYWNYTQNIFGSSCGELATKLVTNVASVFGDMNCDGSVNKKDIKPFQIALYKPDSFPSGEGACSRWNADFNGDLIIDATDYKAFKRLVRH